MNYLFWSRKRKKRFLEDFNRIKEAIAHGKTPVSSEIKVITTRLIEFIPGILIESLFLIISTLILQEFELLNDPVMIVVVTLIVHSIASTLTSVIMVYAKHLLRVLCLKRFGLEVTEDNIAVLESMEYLSL